MLKLPSIFSNHCVFQMNKEVRIWGYTDDTDVTIYLHKGAELIEEINIKALDNKFCGYLTPREAGGTYCLEIRTDNEELRYEDILFGEVWLAGGQSNMELELQNADGWDDIKDRMDQRVRFFYTPKVAFIGDELYEAEKNNAWQTNTSEYRKAWSAVGYYFGEKLAKEKDIPIGIIGCNWGGTSASCWISREALSEEEELKTYLEEYDAKTLNQDFDEYLKELHDYEIYSAEFDKKVQEYYSTHENPTWDEAIALCGECKYPGPMGPRNWTRPCGLYESMLLRVAPFTINGFIFYQGEEDDNRPYIYETLLEALIKEWRKEFKDDTLPFLIVQLPVFRNDGEDDYKNWPFIREAQSHICDRIPNTGLAVILEAGEEINIHPTNKRLVGERLAAVANNSFIYPKYESYEIKNSFMYIHISNSDGLHSINKDGLLSGFEIAGEDRAFYPATVAVIPGENDTIVRLNSVKVEKPVYARYFWKNYAKVEIFGKNDTPLAPFRTSTEDGAKAIYSRQGELKQ